MSHSFMTIETVHGVRETVSVDHFIVGPQQVSNQQIQEKREPESVQSPATRAQSGSPESR